jgi:hypothetical protein
MTPHLIINYLAEQHRLPRKINQKILAILEIEIIQQENSIRINPTLQNQPCTPIPTEIYFSDLLTVLLHSLIFYILKFDAFYLCKQFLKTICPYMKNT